MKFNTLYILYIYVSKLKELKMTIKEPNKIDEKLTKMYENQVTTNTSSNNWEDRSQLLMAQMNFIALNNKSFLNIK